MNKPPIISVMILCYNCEKLVNRALQAAANQTYRNFNIVFIDNGSTDSSKSIYDSFKSNHPEIRMRCVSIQKNIGPARGWNEGLNYADGEYVLFNDADDWMDENCLYELAKKAMESGADRITAQYREVSTNGKTIRTRRIVCKEDCLLPTAMLQGTIFRKSVFADNGIYFPESGNAIAYDFEVVYRFVLNEVNSGVVIRKTLYNYLIHNDSVIQTNSSPEFAWEYLCSVTIPLFRVTAMLAGTANDEDLSQQMVYLVLRNYYSRYVSLYRKLDRMQAFEVCSEMRNNLKLYLPDYQNNKYIKPLFNGYEQPGSFAIWMLCLLERHKIIDTILGKLSPH